MAIAGLPQQPNNTEYLNGLSMSIGGKDYNPQYDPLFQSSQIPAMANRKFLVNQAILSNSSIVKRNFGQTSKSSRVKAGASQNKSARQDQNVKIINGQKEQDELLSFQQIEEAETRKTDGATDDDVLSANDPIKTLKAIFQQTTFKTGPLEINPIMKKYRKENRKTKAFNSMQDSNSIISAYPNLGQMMTETGGGNRNIFSGGGKTFKEDYFEQQKPSKFSVFTPPANNQITRPQSSNRNNQTNIIEQNDESPENSQDQPQPTQRAHQLKDYIYDQQSTNQAIGQSIQQKLENLKRIFDQEEISNAVKDIERKWKEEEEEQEYVNKYNKQSGQDNMFVKSSSTAIASKASDNDIKKFLAQAIDPINDDNIPVNDLRKYLAEKIRDAQQRLNANMMLNSVLPNHEKELQDGFPDDERRFTFKASTLTHIAELRALGQDRIENQLIERLFRENTDYHYEKYNYQKKQIYAKDAVEFKQQKSQIKNMKTQLDEKLAKWKFKEPKRTKNFVQEQLMKLDKIDKQKKQENSPKRQKTPTGEMTPALQSSLVLRMKKSQKDNDPARVSSQTYQLVNASKSEYQDCSSVLTQVLGTNQTRVMRTSAGVIRTQLQAMEVLDPREEQLSTQRPFLQGSDSRNNNDNVAMTAMIESRESEKKDAESPVIRSSSFEKLINVSKSAVVDLNKSLVNVQDLKENAINRSKEEDPRLGIIQPTNERIYTDLSDGLSSKKRDGKVIPTFLNKNELKVLQSNSGNLMNNLFKSSREKDLLTFDNNQLSPLIKSDNDLSMPNNPVIFPIQQHKPAYYHQENTNIKVNKNKQNFQGLNLMKLQIPDGDIRVSEMIRDYNAIYGYQPDSPQENLHYQTDSEVYTQTRNAFFKRQSLDSRGAGFKKKGMEPNEVLFREIEKAKRRQRSAERKSRGLRAKMLLLAKNQQLPLQQLKVFAGMDLEQTLNLTAGNYHTYFCAKRFNRFPRFTIFFKRDNLGNPNKQRSQSNETIVSLTPQFLQFLMEKQTTGEASKYFSNEISFTQKQLPDMVNTNQVESVMSSLMMHNTRSKSPDPQARVNNQKYGNSVISTKILHSLAHHSKDNQVVQDLNKSKLNSPIKMPTAESKSQSPKKGASSQNQEKPSKQATYESSGLGLLPIDEATKLWQQNSSSNHPQRIQNNLSTAQISSQQPSNQQLVQRPNMQNYDPFERVALVKGIDNQILTSFRTLKRENNIVSDTFKIVHQKFQPLQNKGLFFLQQNRMKGDKFTMYPLTDNEDAMDFAEAQLYAQSLADQNNHTVEANRSNSFDDQRPSLEQNRGMILQARVKYEKKREKLKVPPIDTKNSPVHLQSLLEGVNQELKSSDRKVSKYLKIHQQKEQTDHSTKNEEAIDLSRLDDKLDDRKSSVITQMTKKIMSGKTGSRKSRRNEKKIEQGKYSTRQPVYKLDPNYQIESHVQNQKSDITSADLARGRQNKAAVTMISMPGEIMQGAMSSKLGSRQIIDDPNGFQSNMIKPFSRESQGRDIEARDGISALSGKSPQQIEVKVLTKNDPVDMAFPDQANGFSGSSGGLYQSKITQQNFIYGPSKVSGSLAQLTNTTVKNMVNQKNFAQNANRGSQSSFAKGLIQGGGNIQVNRMNDTQIAAQVSVTSSQTNDLRSQVSPHILQNQGSIISDGRFCVKVNQIDERNTLLNPSFVMNYHVSLPDSNYGTQVRETNADQHEVQEAAKTRFKITTNIQVTLDKDKAKKNAKTSKANLGGAIHKAEQVNIKKKDEPKYGKDFKIPELPPLLAAQLQDGQYQQNKMQNITPTTFQTNKGYNIKKFIDEIYQKEAKSRYHRQYVREDFLMTTSPIFDLSKFHGLKTRGDVLEEVAGAKTRFGGVINDTSKEKIYGLDEKGQLVMHRESQSLTNVLGFQAGGNHVILPYTLPKIVKQQNDYNLTINGESQKGGYPQFIARKSQSQFHPVPGYNHQPFYLNNIMIGSQKMNNAKGSTTLLESIAGGTSDGLTTMPYERGFVSGKDTQFQSNKKSKVRSSDDQRIVSTVSELNKRQSEIIGFMNDADSTGMMIKSPGSIPANEINPQASIKTKAQLI